VDLSRICVKISKNAPSNPIHVADTVQDAMKNILQDNPVIKWQYFASEQGMYWNYPAFEDKADCRAYDPRFRPFYVETATPEPKDVVLVIDHSGSMAAWERMIAAKEAAKIVLKTMNPRDRVSFLPSLKCRPKFRICLCEASLSVHIMSTRENIMTRP